MHGRERSSLVSGREPVETVVCGARCMMVFGADAGGDGGGPNLCLCCFSRPASHSSLLPRLGAWPCSARPPSNAAPPLLGLGCLCLTFKLALAVSMTWPPALLHPQDKLGSHRQGSECVAEPAPGGGRLSVQACAARGLGQIPRHGVRGVQEQALGVGVRVTGHPCYSGTRPSSCVLCEIGRGPLLACRLWRR